ncbi:TIGR03936 family radical SAM-associated protein [Zavarzinella formosa]|uniref:TIGR03936 family radical SAM-associated protein n=1 Tax=Zavarzinella formosa TaxID=360055 RepID=UPI0002D80F6D|nr:TIGR03936 family radical SAM-associated protein [Zavarzinella formosa]
MAFDKVRIRFCKSGDLRLVSHLDLMRAFERMLRRASLPIRMTEGFHPAPRLIFAQSLSLGLIGLDEVVELEFTEEIPPEDVLERFRKQAPPGLIIHSARRIPLKLAARPRRAVYRWPLTEQFRDDVFKTQVSDRLRELMAQPEVWSNREKPRPRQVNIRPYLRAAWTDAGSLWFDIWLTQEGTARVDELARLLGLEDLYLTGPAVERVTLEISDELAPEEIAQTPTIAQQVRPWKGEPTKPAAVETPREVWGATSNGPIVE